MRLPDGDAQREFCRVDGWTSERESGHTVYRKELATGEILTTLVAHSNRQINDPDLFSYICREQLRCTVAQFWEAVDRGVPVPRPQPEEPPRREGIPLGLIQALRALGHSDDRIGQLRTKDEAVALLRKGPAPPD